MTPEQITTVLQILSNAPTQALLAIAIFILWRFSTGMLTTSVAWLRDELSKYMERDRNIVAAQIQPAVPTASKWSNVAPETPK